MPFSPHHCSRTGPRPTTPNRARRGFPTQPEPAWTPDQPDRWREARAIAEASPDTSGKGGWTVEQLPVCVGSVVALAVTGAGGVASILAAVYGAGLYVGLAGIVASGLAGMVLVWHLPPADLALADDAIAGRGEGTSRRDPDAVHVVAGIPNGPGR